MDVTAIRTALSNQITANVTGLRGHPQANDAVDPPCLVVLPGKPFAKYGATLGGTAIFHGVPMATTEMMFSVLILVSIAPTADRWQQNLDAYLGFGPSPENSVPWALALDPSLGGVVDYAIPIQVSQYGLIDYAGQQYAGAHLEVQVVAD